MKQMTVIVMVMLLLTVHVTQAQTNVLDPVGTPTYGSITLEAGFLPDPWIVSAVSGGEVDASQSGLGAGCVGFISSVPNFTLTYSGTPLSGNLRILFVGAGDTMLVVSDPNGSYFCNDTSTNTDPLIDFPAPAAGNYTVWVGSVGVNTPIHGYLMVTEVQTASGVIYTDIPGFVTSLTELTGEPADATLEAQPADAAPLATPLVPTATSP